MELATNTAAKGANLMSYDGRTSNIYGVWIKNVLLQIITFGIYRAWAKTNMRRYLWSSYKIDGDRLTYTGLGGELFRGYVKVYFIIFLLSLFGLAISMIFEDTSNPHYNEEVHASNFIIWAAIIYLVYFGKFSALRYRLTRTTWRGIRGMLVGSGRAYVGFRLKRLLINIVTLGYCMGRTGMLDNKYLAERVYFGSQKCTYSGDENALDKINLITLLLAIPTLGISRLWYRSALLNAKYNYLQAGSVHFHATFTPGKLFRLAFGNMLIMIFTFFLGMPIVIQRIMRCFSQNVQVLGSIEGSNIMQTATEAGNLGEGVADYMDDGLDFDMGIF